MAAAIILNTTIYCFNFEFEKQHTVYNLLSAAATFIAKNNQHYSEEGFLLSQKTQLVECAFLSVNILDNILGSLVKICYNKRKNKLRQ